MMKVKKTSYPPINMGISLMLVIFIVLCMIVFAMLSLSTALKDYNYSKKNAENTTVYYEACNLAETELAQIQKNISNYTEDEEVEYFVSVDKDQSLQVILELHPSENTYEIKTWKLISTKDWNGDDRLSVIGSHK